jgi:hypothetical protein
MRGPIRTPILLRFGNCNTPAEPQRAVPCAVNPGHACRALRCLAISRLPSLSEPRCAVRIRPRLPRPSWPTTPHRACRAWPCRSSPGSALRSSPATTYTARPCLPGLPIRALPFEAIRSTPCLPVETMRFLTDPDLTTPCLQIPAVNATRTTPATTGPAITALPRLPIHARPCPHYLDCRSRPCHHCLACRVSPSQARPSRSGLAMPAVP